MTNSYTREKAGGPQKLTLRSLSYDRVNGMIQSKVNDNKNSEIVLSFHY